MSELVRFGVSIDAGLLDRYDQLIAGKGYVNRSEAVRDLIRNALVEEQWQQSKEEIVGTVTLVYDHHTRELSQRLTRHQHERHEAILASLHVHLDEHNCLETVVIRGDSSQVRKLADELIGTKGVKHGRLVTTTTGKDLV